MPGFLFSAIKRLMRRILREESIGDLLLIDLTVSWVHANFYTVRLKAVVKRNHFVKLWLDLATGCEIYEVDIIIRCRISAILSGSLNSYLSFSNIAVGNLSMVSGCMQRLSMDRR